MDAFSSGFAALSVSSVLTDFYFYYWTFMVSLQYLLVLFIAGPYTVRNGKSDLCCTLYFYHAYSGYLYM